MNFLKFIYFLYNLGKDSPKKKHMILLKLLEYKKKNFIGLQKSFFFSSFFDKKNSKLLKKRFYFLGKRTYIFKKFSPKQLFTWWSKIISFYQVNKQKKIYVLLVSSIGAYFIKPLAWGVYFKEINLPTSYYNLFSTPLPLGYSFFINPKVFSCYFYNLILKKKVVASSPGAYSNFIFFDLSANLYFLKLPSGMIITTNDNCYVYVGRNSNIYNNKIVRGGFFSKFWPKNSQYISTRGVSMNPVDHPNGGRTRVKTPLKTPWGKIAKKSK